MRHSATLLLWSLAGAASAHEIEGVWRFEKEVDTRPDGTVVDLRLPAYDGLLTYTADGFVTAIVMPQGRRWTADSATRADLASSVFEGASTAYAGRYEIARDGVSVVHIPFTSIDPGDIGRRLVRSYRVHGDELQLSGKFIHAGQELLFTVYWHRQTPGSDNRVSAPHTGER